MMEAQVLITMLFFTILLMVILILGAMYELKKQEVTELKVEQAKLLKDNAEAQARYAYHLFKLNYVISLYNKCSSSLTAFKYGNYKDQYQFKEQNGLPDKITKYKNVKELLE